MRDLTFTTDEFYHVYNRGTDGRQIFLIDADFKRGLQSLHLFNDSRSIAPTNILQRIEALSFSEHFDFEMERFVEIVSYCLIPNHFHLLLRQLKEDGISRFMHKFEMSYSQYLNKRLDRTGTLYEGRFQAVHVNNDTYLQHIPVYMHLNALDVGGFKWRDGLVDDWDAALDFLASYRWSSHGAYIGKRQYLPIIQEEIVQLMYSSPEDYLTHIKGWSQRNLSEHLANFR